MLRVGQVDSGARLVQNQCLGLSRSSRADGPVPLEISLHSNTVHSLAFLPDGKRVAIGCEDGTVQIWHIEDGRSMEVVMKENGPVYAVVACKNGRWIVTGGRDQKVTVWGIDTGQEVHSIKSHRDRINAIDIGPDSLRVASVSNDKMLIIWDIALQRQLPVQHSNKVTCVAFSPSGHSVATVTDGYYGLFRVWNSQTGCQLFEVKAKIPYSFSWLSEERLLASCSEFTQCLDASSRGGLLTKTLSTVLSFASSADSKQVVGHHHGVVRFLDSATCTWSHASLKRNSYMSVITLSPDGSCLVTGEKDKICVWNLPDIVPKESTDFMHITSAVHDAWIVNRLEDVDHLLSDHIARHWANHHTFANRAIVRTRLKRWDDAIEDAIESIRIWPSVIGHVAKSFALCGKGLCGVSLEEFDLAFRVCHTGARDFLLLIKSLVLFQDRQYEQAISRIDHLINLEPHPLYHVVQAQMCVLAAQAVTEQKDLERAAMLMKRGRDPGPVLHDRELETISLLTGWTFHDSEVRFAFYRQRCKTLYTIGSTEEAAESLRSMMTELKEEIGARNEGSEWFIDFKRRCLEALKRSADKAAHASNHRETTRLYSLALNLEPNSHEREQLLLKRSKERVAMQLWDDAIKDADEAIALNPSSHWGYERRHAALHGACRYDEAIEAHKSMLQKLEEPSNPLSRELRPLYVTPDQTRAAIHGIVTPFIHNFPFALIDTHSGYVYSERERIHNFELQPEFTEIISSMTSPRIDYDRIRQTVVKYFAYAALSHTWDETELVFRDVVSRTVYDLPGSPAAAKLQRFCEAARRAGFRWAWCDTCCINKEDLAVLQESLNSMFLWYSKSSLTFVHLTGVHYPPKPGDLANCRWNKRAWTLQEYFASTDIQFYCEDWNPYLSDPHFPNHKQSPLILHEMEIATGVTAEALVALRPGSENVREKLSLASTRIAAKQEDTAYSLFGIFDVTIPAVYGEGHRAVGRLLEAIVTRSGDASILAWTGKPSNYNSCLPAEIRVYEKTVSLLVPAPIEDDEMERLVSELRASLSPCRQELAEELHDRLANLASPHFTHTRLSLSCLEFPLTGLGKSTDTDSSLRFYRARTALLEDVDIKTMDDLSKKHNLVLIHPWIQALLDSALYHDSGVAEASTPHDWGPSFSVLPLRPSTPLDKRTRALRLLARLRQPFGALLLAPRGYKEYTRVAADCQVIVRIRDNASLEGLMTRNLDVL